MTDDDLALIFAGEGADADPWLGEGWQPAEAEFRWTDGPRSVVRLPAMRARPWFVLTLDAYPYGGGVLALIVRLNGTEIARYLHHPTVPYDIVVRGELVSADAENRLELEYPQTTQPSQTVPGSTDSRVLAFAFRRLSLATLEEPPYAAPVALPEVAASLDKREARAVAEAVQSLGQHCDLGLFQRRYGAEPFGLLRFASIFPPLLIHGLKTRFAGIGDVAALSFFLPGDSREWDGRHAVYGLAYHTFRSVDEIDAATLAAKEGPRLKYLARLLCEQLENNEKIFVRVENFEPLGEILALHRLLQTYHPQARLLQLQAASADARERVGRVYELRPGLYRGYLSRRSDIAGARDPTMYQEWLKLCATVVAYEKAGLTPDSDAIAPADEVRLIFFGEGENAEPYLREGWHPAETEFRWTDGARSVLRLPAMRARAWRSLTLRCWPLNNDSVTQRLTVWLNGTELKCGAPGVLVPFQIVFPGELMRTDGENVLTLDHPDAVRPSDVDPGDGDGRLLALALHSLEIESQDDPLFVAPRLLPVAEPPRTSADAKTLSEMFESLGGNGDPGVVQRTFGAEPFGLLHFAAIGREALAAGLKTRFAGIGDVDKLSFFREGDSGRHQGRHADYGLNFPTHLAADETKPEAVAATQAQRLNYLARLLIQQLENDEKIFVRQDSFDTTEDARALHQLMRGYNPRARLLLVGLAPAHAPERVGRVIEIRSGLYRGYLSRLSSPALTPDSAISQEWLKLCATVAAYDSALARAAPTEAA